MRSCAFGGELEEQAVEKPEAGNLTKIHHPLVVAGDQPATMSASGDRMKQAGTCMGASYAIVR